ncbi:MAG: hypothetical protein FJ197_10755 [Gammaproteobacteria bacterium]|nr:hypothetical protein [Gammaproteobacteria bacterium]
MPDARTTGNYRLLKLLADEAAGALDPSTADEFSRLVSAAGNAVARDEMMRVSALLQAALLKRELAARHGRESPAMPARLRSAVLRQADTWLAAGTTGPVNPKT